jgi:uncharacterized protein YggU (UPF0235/DUF167 family)
MIGREFRFHDGKKGSALAIRVTVGGDETQFTKVLRDGTVLVTINGHPDKLNQELINFLASQLQLPVKQLDVIAGFDGEDKLISILDTTPEKVQQMVLKKLS